MIINPGQGHVRHLHEHADELIYVISGTGTQTVGLEEFPISEGEAVYIPMGTLHSTMNNGWRTLRLIVTYTPGGEEQALPDSRGTRRARSSAGSAPRSDSGLVQPGRAWSARGGSIDADRLADALNNVADYPFVVTRPP